jgi:hypothetical protein
MDGDIAELIIYNAKLSDHDRQRVEVYLARKWGLLSIMPSSVPSPSDASKNPFVSSIGGNSVTTSVPLVDNGGADANVTVFYGTVDAGLSSATSGGTWSPTALGTSLALWFDAKDLMRTVPLIPLPMEILQAGRIKVEMVEMPPWKPVRPS